MQRTLKSTHDLMIVFVIFDLPLASSDLMLQRGLQQSPLISMLEYGRRKTDLPHRRPDVPEDPGRLAITMIAAGLANAAELAYKRQEPTVSKIFRQRAVWT